MKKNEFLHFSVSLGAIVIIATAGLSKVYVKTQNTIARQEQKKVADALEFVLPKADSFQVVSVPAPQDSYWVGRNKQGGVEGAAFRVRGRGYSSELVSIVGIDTAGKIVRMRILSQSETPGLGTRVEEVASSSTLWNPSAGSKSAAPWFQEQFFGLSAGKEIGIIRSQEWPRMSAEARASMSAQNAISGLTGATISSRAVSQPITDKGEDILNHFRSLFSAAGDTAIKESVAIEESHAPADH